jgi:hypothetical protein
MPTFVSLLRDSFTNGVPGLAGLVTGVVGISSLAT